jgi:hypothetical protein
MLNLKKWTLGAALAAGVMGMATTQANAAEFRVVVGGPVAYVPPCPGAGYEWAAGYYANGFWVPGRWNFIGVRGPAPIVRFDARPDFHQDFHRGYTPRFDHLRR